MVNIIKAKKVAVISDTTGYGTASLNAYVPMLKTIGAEVVYEGSVELNNPDLKPELLRMQAAGAQAIMPWSVNAGFLSRIINTRAEMNWDIPIVGQTTLGSGQTKALLKKPEYWEKVYPNNFRNCSYNAAGALPPRTVEFVERIRKANIEMSDTLLWWIALGYDGPRLMAEAIKAAGSAPGGDRGLLEQGQGLARRLWQHHLDARVARRLPERRDRDVPSQFAKGWRLHARARLHRIDRCWYRSSPTAWR